MLLASLCLLSGTYWVLWSLLLEHPIRWRDYEAAVRQFAPTFLAVHVLLSVIGVVYTLVASGLTLPLLRLTGAYDSGNRSLSLIIVRGFSSFLYRCMEVYVLAWVYAGGLRLRGAFQQGLLSNNLLPWERMPVLLVVALICGAEAVISKLMLSESVPYWAFVGISTGRHLLLGLLLAIAFVTACQSVSEASERNK
jgi:hypothetical protein